MSKFILIFPHTPLSPLSFHPPHKGKQSQIVQNDSARDYQLPTKANNDKLFRMSVAEITRGQKQHSSWKNCCVFLSSDLGNSIRSQDIIVLHEGKENIKFMPIYLYSFFLSFFSFSAHLHITEPEQHQFTLGFEKQTSQKNWISRVFASQICSVTCSLEQMKS